MPDQPIISGTCVVDKSNKNTRVQIFQLSNGKHKGIVRYQNPRMEKPLVLETDEADDIPQAKQFIYFILNQASEG